MATEYIVDDRSDGNKYAIKIDDGHLFFDVTLDASSSEPIVQDNTNSSDYWKIFIDDGQLGFESTVTVQDDEVDLEDSTLGVDWRLGVNDGQLYYFQITTAVRQLLSIKSEDGFRVIIKSVENTFAIKSDMRS